MYKKAMLLYNQEAGNQDIKDILSMAAHRLTTSIDELTFIKTKKKGDAENYCRTLGSDVDLVIIVGGDGTVHECVNGLHQLTNPPAILILPTGTCNDFARSLGIPVDIQQAIESFERMSVKNVDIGVANERAFSNFCGVGVITEAARGTNVELKERFGKFSYFISAFQSLQNPTPFQYQLTADHHHQETGEAIMILAMNGLSLGTTHLTHQASKLDDGKVDVYIIKEAGLSLLKNFMTKATSPDHWPSEMEGIEIIQADHFSLTTDTEREIDLDGEIYLNTPLQLSVKRHNLPFLIVQK